MNELEILEELKRNKLGKDLKLTTEFYNTYDAYDEKVIIEFKYRKKEYGTYIAEAHKIINNFHCSQKQDKIFYYINITELNIHIWNITEIICGNKLKFETKYLPKNNNTNEKIIKLITYLETKDSLTIKRKKDETKQAK